MKILLDYAFPISVINALPAASTAFLKQVCLVCKPKTGQEGNVGEIFQCVSNAEVAVRTDNTNAAQFFNAGMSKVFILLSNDLDLEDALNENLGRFFTLIISDDFVDADIIDGVVTEAVKSELKIQDILYRAKVAGEDGDEITINYDSGGTAGSETVDVTGDAITITIEDGVSTAQQIVDAIEADVDANALVECIIDDGDESDAQDVFGAAVALEGGVDEVTGSDINVGQFDGVVGISTQDQEVAEDQAAIANRASFFTNVTNKAKNLCYAFGSLLSNLVNWKNQQYIVMPFNDGIESLGVANSLFDEKVSFVINDDEFGNVLALFAAGGKAIVAPYILKNFKIDVQSKAVTWISANQPSYTNKEASLLEEYITKEVIDVYINRGWLTAATINIVADQGNFVASGYLNVAEPKALWRVFSEMSQTL